ncbi:MAG: hypothetical protein O2945_13450, partial [Planctomycetota bacterium]|nr:hypothetical protein [Planctomycetota bacterium]
PFHTDRNSIVPRPILPQLSDVQIDATVTGECAETHGRQPANKKARAQHSGFLNTGLELGSASF